MQVKLFFFKVKDQQGESDLNEFLSEHNIMDVSYDLVVSDGETHAFFVVEYDDDSTVFDGFFDEYDDDDDDDFYDEDDADEDDDDDLDDDDDDDLAF